MNSNWLPAEDQEWNERSQARRHVPPFQENIVFHDVHTFYKYPDLHENAIF